MDLMELRGLVQAPGPTISIMSEQSSVTKHMNNLMGKLLWVLAALATAGTAANAVAASQPTPAAIEPLAVQAQLNDVAAAGDKLVAVGERGIIITSQDGEEWTQVPSPVNAMLNAVTFADDQHGWAVGHDASILYTGDGGQSWSVQAFGGNGGNPFLDVLFTDAKTGYAVGAFGLFKVTDDGGKTWADLADTTLSDNGFHMYDLLQADDGTFVLVGEMGLVAISVDGRNWVILDVPYDGSLYSAIPEGERGLLVVGMRGNAFRTADLCNPQWEPVSTGVEKPLFDLAQLGNGRVAAAGRSEKVVVLEAGRAPSVLEFADRPEGETLDEIFTVLLPWKGKLYAATGSGVQVIAALN
ncbi:MAG: WD40/YVTN/BNR-like repeat-containing protein [Panacagrimonas sp.]